jgi:hypothetical protein
LQQLVNVIEAFIFKFIIDLMFWKNVILCTIFY